MSSAFSLEENKEMLEPWLCVIGLITVMWSSVERKIDECVVIIKSTKSNGKKLMKLADKLNYIKENLPKDISCISDLDEIIRLTKGTSQVRDICVHGVIENYDADKMSIGKVQGRSEDYHVEMYTFDKNQLSLAGNNLNYVFETWELIASDLHKLC